MSESQQQYFSFGFEDVYFLIYYTYGHVNSCDNVCNNSCRNPWPIRNCGLQLQ